MPIRVHDLLAAKAHVLKLAAGSVEAVATLVGLTSEVLNASIGIISGDSFKSSHRICTTRRAQCAAFRRTTASLDELAEERVYELVERLQQNGISQCFWSRTTSASSTEQQTRFYA